MTECEFNEFFELVELMRVCQIAAQCSESPAVIKIAGKLEHAVDEWLFEFTERHAKESCTVGWHASRCLGQVGSNPAPTTDDHWPGA